ncbi:MAG: class I SAM-dependent methyltransferase, partial [Nitrososphaerota archaeon]|nr:class I SAM-dependent methyltransferase [Nitrososphaerota archaeon]
MGSGIKPYQIREEISQLLHILKTHPPRVILEIGTAAGGTLFLFTQVASLSGKVLSVDISTGYPRWRIPLYESFARSRS